MFSTEYYEVYLQAHSHDDDGKEFAERAHRRMIEYHGAQNVQQCSRGGNRSGGPDVAPMAESDQAL